MKLRLPHCAMLAHVGQDGRSTGRALYCNGTVHTLALHASPKLAGRGQRSMGASAGCITYNHSQT